MGQNTVSITEFARKLKEKYPKYAGAADDKLVVAFCQKFPQYQVNYEAGTPVSVSLVAPPAAPSAPSVADSEKAAPAIAHTAVPSIGSNESSQPSSVPSVSEPAKDSDEVSVKVEEKAPVAPTVEVEPPVPPPVEAETPVPPTIPSSADSVSSNVQRSPKADTAGVPPKAAPPSRGVNVKPVPVITPGPSDSKRSHFGIVIFGILIVVVLALFAASQYGVIPWKFLPSTQKDAIPQAGAEDAGGVAGEFIGGRTTYSDDFVNVESIRIRRSGRGSILAATVYNKSQSKLNSVIINVSCYSGSGTQVVNASFTIRDLAPGARATKDMTGTLTAVPSRVDIVRVNRY